MEKALLNVKETAEYLNMSQTKVRDLLKEPNGFGVQIGGRLYANKLLLDRWLTKVCAIRK